MKTKTPVWCVFATALSLLMLLATSCTTPRENSLPTVSLTISAQPEGAGTVSGGGEYSPGEEVNLKAVPHDGYMFLEWTNASGEVVSNQNRFRFTMPDEQVVLTAAFREAVSTVSPVTDVDGNEYQVIRIGGQVWMAENLRTTSYRDGSDIPGELKGSWGDRKEGAYSVYPPKAVEDIDSREAIINAYGILYNWYAVTDERGLCPQGWHVPANDEITQLIDNLLQQDSGLNQENLGNALKSCFQVDSPLGGACDTSEHPRWNTHDTHYGRDVFNFNALPAGNRASHGKYNNLGRFWTMWTATEHDQDHAMILRLRENFGGYLRDANDKTTGFSVRCIKD